MKRLGYILHINGLPTGHGAVMTPAEAEHTNETLPPGHEWKNPMPPGSTPFDVERLDGTVKSYASGVDYEHDLKAGEIDNWRRRATEFIRTENQVEKAA